MALTQIKAGGLAAESVDSDAYVDGSIDNAHLADDAANSDEIAAGAVDIAHLSASGTAGSGNFLRGDNSWNAPAAAAITAIASASANQVLTDDGDATVTSESNLTFDGTDLLIGSTGKLYFNDAGGEYLYGTGASLHFYANDDLDFHTAGGTIYWDGSQYYPATNDGPSLGYTARIWEAVWSGNGAIQTSDRNKKENIEDSSLGLEFLNLLTPRQYKMKDTETKTYVRTHYGLIAQEVEQVLEDNGIATKDFAAFIKAPVLDGGTTGEPTGEYNYHMRYDEYTGILIKAVQELSSENDSLKARVEALESA